MPNPNPKLNGQIFYVPGNPDIYWIDNGLARHIPDEATYHGVFGGSPNKQAYSALLAEVTVGKPIADGTELVRAGNDAKIYFVENQTKRWITDERAKAYFQLNGNVHSLPLATVNSFANGPAFVDPDPPPPDDDDDDNNDDDDDDNNDDDDDDDDGGDELKQPEKPKS